MKYVASTTNFVNKEEPKNSKTRNRVQKLKNRAKNSKTWLGLKHWGKGAPVDEREKVDGKSDKAREFNQEK